MCEYVFGGVGRKETERGRKTERKGDRERNNAGFSKVYMLCVCCVCMCVCLPEKDIEGIC